MVKVTSDDGKALVMEGAVTGVRERRSAYCHGNPSKSILKKKKLVVDSKTPSHQYSYKRFSTLELFKVKKAGKV
jgi:hypothetical protein